MAQRQLGHASLNADYRSTYQRPYGQKDPSMNSAIAEIEDCAAKGIQIHPVPLDEFTLDGLHPELHEYVVWDGPFGPMFDHPLVRDMFLQFTAARPELRPHGNADFVIPAGLEAINDAVERSCKCRDKAFEKKDWFSFIFNHERPYRVDALLGLLRDIRTAQFGRLVRSVWMDAEEIMAACDEWTEVWAHVYHCGKLNWRFKRLMGTSDRRIFDALPEVVTVYRGCRSEDEVLGYSWSLRRSTAEWFATRDASEGVLAEAEVHRSLVMAYFDERNEAEVVVDFECMVDEPAVTHVRRANVADIVH